MVSNDGVTLDGTNHTYIFTKSDPIRRSKQNVVFSEVQKVVQKVIFSISSQEKLKSNTTLISKLKGTKHITCLLCSGNYSPLSPLPATL